MADIATELAAILEAVYGEQVRGSIHDALAKMNSDLNTAIGHQLLTVDNTLSVTGAGADAKKTGDELSQRLALSYADYTALSAGINLNVVAGTPGNYKIETTAIAETIANIPIQQPGRLIVMPAGTEDGGIQLYITSAVAGSVKFFIRGWKGYTWTSWVDLTEIKGLVDNYIKVSDTQPTSTLNKLWLPTTIGEGVEVPTWEEFEELDNATSFATLDLLTKTGRVNTTDAGITFTWNADKTACTVNGTVSGSIPAAQYFNGSTTSIPEGFEPGKTYHVTMKSTSNDAGIGAYYYKNNGTYFSATMFRADTTFTIPSDATGMRIFVFVQNEKSVSNDVVSDFGIFEYETNAQIAEKTEQFYQETKKSLEDGSYLLRFERKELTNNQNKTYTSSQKGLATDVLYFDNKFLKIVVDSGYKAAVYFTSQSGGYIRRDLSVGTHFFYAGSNIPIVFSLFKDPISFISIEDEKHITVTEVNPEKTNEIGCGIKDHPIEWDNECGISYDYLYYYNSAANNASRPIKIPKSGMRIGFNPKYHTTTFIDTTESTVFKYPSFTIRAVKKSDNGLVLQTDNEDLNAVSKSRTSNRWSVYIPYVEDCYIIIRLLLTNAVQGVDYSDLLYVSSGKVDRSFCGVYNIFPTSVRINPNMTGFSGINSFDPQGRQSEWYSYSSMLYYATVIRLRDVNKIVCEPKYTLMAEIFKINNNGSVTRETDVWGSFCASLSGSASGQTSTSGLAMIDFTQYDFDGYAMVCIQAPILYVKTGESTYSYKLMTTGNLGGYEDVINGVCVEYKNGVSVSKLDGMPSILEENMHQIMNWRVPVYGDGFYVEQADTTPHYFPTQYDCVPSMYNGTYVANSLFMQVTAKSALTCLKNRNGRMRKMQRIESSQGTPTKGNIGYGLTCTCFASVIEGLKENYTSWARAYGTNRKFDRYNFDYRYDIDKLRPGDVLVKHVEEPEGGRYTNSHCMTVESIIVVNGVVKAVNIIEATVPYCRRRTYLDESYYMAENNPLIKMYTMDLLADYHWISRIKPEYLKPITKAFDMYPSNTEVGTVMCDRGTDSIYGIHTGYVELSFKDEDVTTYLYLYKNGTLLATIAKSGAGTVNGLRLINVASYLDGEGLYTVKTDKSNDVQETFYVKADVDRVTHVETETEVTLTVPDMEHFLWMEIWYGNTSTQEEAAQRKSPTYVKEDLTIEEGATVGTITIPRYIGGKEWTSIDRVYETNYGAYWANRLGRVSTDYYGLDS